MVTKTNTAVETVVTLDRVSKQFGARNRRHTAVHETSLRFDNSMRVGLIGESGSGKSTLARMMVGLETPTTGEIKFGSQNMRSILGTKAGRVEYRRAVQFIGQDTTSSFDPRHKLIESVLKPSMLLCGLTAAEAMERAEETLEYLGLPRALADRYPGQVSGGQRQRFAIARALVVRPQMLICDEVVSALDVSVQGAVLNLLKDYCERNLAGLVFVSHGLPATTFVANELLVMYMGHVIERGTTDDVIERPQEEYTRFLLDAHRGTRSQEVTV
jgi:peptide/nickel transport system ATP-binding protein